MAGMIWGDPNDFGNPRYGETTFQKPIPKCYVFIFSRDILVCVFSQKKRTHVPSPEKLDLLGPSSLNPSEVDCHDSHISSTKRNPTTTSRRKRQRGIDKGIGIECFDYLADSESDAGRVSNWGSNNYTS